MWTYNTNVMGPFGLWWYEENNVPYEMVTINNRFTNYKDVERKNYLLSYYGGRIDTYCSNPDDKDYDHYMPELGLPIMEAKYFAKFDEWLDTVKTDSLVTFEDLKQMYEEETKETLLIFKD